jgi:hypothetical protein
VHPDVLVLQAGVGVVSWPREEGQLVYGR